MRFLRRARPLATDDMLPFTPAELAEFPPDVVEVMQMVYALPPDRQDLALRMMEGIVSTMEASQRCQEWARGLLARIRGKRATQQNEPTGDCSDEGRN